MRTTVTVVSMVVLAGYAQAAELSGRSTGADWGSASDEERMSFSVKAGQIAFPSEPWLVAGYKMFRCLETALGSNGSDASTDPVTGMAGNSLLAEMAAMCGVLSAQ